MSVTLCVLCAGVRERDLQGHGTTHYRNAHTDRQIQPKELLPAELNQSQVIALIVSL